MNTSTSTQTIFDLIERDLGYDEATVRSEPGHQVTAHCGQDATDTVLVYVAAWDGSEDQTVRVCASCYDQQVWG